jgi:hypothetical protein
METDDEQYTVEFDATPYFIHKFVDGTIEETIRDLNDIQWSRDYAADHVAEFFNGMTGFLHYREYQELNEAFEHNAKIPDTKGNENIRGFEVFVENGDLKDWLNDRNPKLAELIE